MANINDPLIHLEYDISLLRKLYPLKELGLDEQQQMARKSHVLELLPGDELKASEEHRWMLYLLEGKLDLLGHNKPPELLQDSTPHSYFPLFSEQSDTTHVLAQSHCRVIRFDRQLFATLMDQSIMSGEELETIEVSEVEGTLFNEIMHAFNSGELALPSLPEIAVKVKKAASNPDVSVDDVVHIIEADPAMAARLIQVANSPLNASYEPVRGIKGAVVRLGLSNTRELVVSLSIKQLFNTSSSLLKQRMQRLYQHSVDIAAISYSVASIAGGLDVDHVLLAGLIHDIGIIPILNYIDQTGLEVTEEAELENIVEKLRAVVGSLIVKQWDLSSDFIAAIENSENWYRNEPGKLDLSDVLIVAHIYDCLQRKQVRKLPKISKVPVFKKLYSEHISTEFAQQVLEQSKQQIDEVKRLLRL